MRLPQWKHQAEEHGHRHDPARALLWQPRVGKTKTVIDAACALREEADLDGVVVVAPNGVHGNWAWRELPKHHWDGMTYASYVWRFSDKENLGKFERFLEDAATCDLAWLCVNNESMIRPEVMRAVQRFRAVFPRHMLVGDESHHFRRAGAKRTARMRAWARHALFRRILTGTALDNSPLHAFSQFEILEKAALGFDRYEEFEQRYAEYKMVKGRGGRGYEMLDRYKNLEELRDRMAPYSSVVLRSDCGDIPNLIRVSRCIEPTDRQLRLYRAILKDGTEDMESVGLYRQVAGGARWNKLQQVLSGFVIGDDGVVNHLEGGNPRLDACMEEIAEEPRKTLVWCQYTQDIRNVCGELQKEGIPFVEYHGKMEGDGEESLRTFEEYRGKMVFVGQPMAGGEGLTIPAQKIIWYSHTPDAIVRTQADERATVSGGEDVAVVDLEVHGSVDSHWLELVAAKRSLADEVAREGLRAVLDKVRL